MPDYKDENSFVLFLEAEKKTEKSPDYTGTLTDENGKKWRIAAWKRISSSGSPFLSGKVSEQMSREQSGYESFKQQGENLKQKDTVHQFDEDEPIDLSDIPF